MNTINRVEIQGTIIHAVQLKQRNGYTTLSTIMEWRQSYRSQGKEKVQQAVVPLSFFGDAATAFAQQVSTGDEVLIKGKFDSYTMTSFDGNTMNHYQVRVESFVNLSGHPSFGMGTGQAANSQPEVGGVGNYDDADLPPEPPAEGAAPGGQMNDPNFEQTAKNAYRSLGDFENQGG